MHYSYMSNNKPEPKPRLTNEIESSAKHKHAGKCTRAESGTPGETRRCGGVNGVSVHTRTTRSQQGNTGSGIYPVGKSGNSGEVSEISDAFAETGLFQPAVLLVVRQARNGQPSPRAAMNHFVEYIAEGSLLLPPSCSGHKINHVDLWPTPAVLFRVMVTARRGGICVADIFEAGPALARIQPPTIELLGHGF